MTTKTVTVSGEARFTPTKCGEYDDEDFPGDPCEFLVHGSELEHVCFKFGEALKDNANDEALRCAECKKELGQ